MSNHVMSLLMYGVGSICFLIGTIYQLIDVLAERLNYEWRLHGMWKVF
jgi:hypothetical protein